MLATPVLYPSVHAVTCDTWGGVCLWGTLISYSVVYKNNHPARGGCYSNVTVVLQNYEPLIHF